MNRASAKLCWKCQHQVGVPRMACTCSQCARALGADEIKRRMLEAGAAPSQAMPDITQEPAELGQLEAPVLLPQYDGPAPAEAIAEPDTPLEAGEQRKRKHGRNRD